MRVNAEYNACLAGADLVASSGENGGFTIFDNDDEAAQEKKTLKMISTWHTNRV